jgi:hypothetical protein
VARLRLLVAVVVLGVAGLAHAQSDVTVRGNYWRDRNTRVLQPEVELRKELPSGTVVGAHYLLDAITSASAAAGGGGDQAFTELRNEVGFSLGQRVGGVLVSGSYTYSGESDYTAHSATIGALAELFQKTTLLGVTLAYGNDSVDQRLSATQFMHKGGLQVVRGLVTATQIITPTLLANASYEIGVLGFGNADNGYQANPYRVIPMGGGHEMEPFQRIRQAAALSLHWVIPLRMRLMPYIAFRPAYRFYWDDWGILSHTPELRMYVPAGPVEFRVTGRYYTQREASFWSDGGGVTPMYPNGVGLHCTTCLLASSKSGLFLTADPKLSPFSSAFFELGVLVKLNGLRRWKRLPGSAWLADGYIQLSYGHYFNGGYPHVAFGDAEVAGITMAWPF